MNNIQKNNLLLLNLMENNISGITLLRVINSCQDHYIMELDLKKELGETPTYRKIKSLFEMLDRSYHSIYCLYYFGVNLFIIERLRNDFSSLEYLSTNLKKLSEHKLQSRTESIIFRALDELGLNTIVSLENLLIKEIESNEPIQNNELKEKILNCYHTLSVDEFDKAINSLIEQGIIAQTIDGIEIKKNTINKFLEMSSNEKDKIVHDRLKGLTLQEIANKKNLTRERIRQIILKRIEVYPTFYNEKKYYRLLSLYDLSSDELLLLNYSDLLLVEYIKQKYELNPSKNALDYIADFNLKDTDLARKILKNNKLVIINGELVSKSFIEIFRKYVNTVPLYSFSLLEVRTDFNEFLANNCIYDQELYIELGNDLIIKSRKLDNSSYFLSCGNQIYFVFRPDSFSCDFYDSLNSFLSEFYGYGSASLFFDNNKELCMNNHITNEKELFVVTKELFQEKFRSKIEFIRNPTFATRGIDRESYIENLLLDLDLPCSVQDYLDYINKVTGLKQDSINANFASIINQYKNSQGLLTLDDEVSNEQYEYVKSVIGDDKCVSYFYVFNKLETKYGGNVAQKIINRNNLKKIGFIKTNNSIYAEKYYSRLDAVIDAINNLDEYIITQFQLSKIANIEYYTSKMYDFIDSNILLKISDSKYLNLKKRNQTHLLSNLKKDFLVSLSDDKVYTIDKYLISSSFDKLLDKNIDYKDLLYSFDTEQIIKYLVLTLREMNYIEKKQTFIFSKKSISICTLINEILMEDGSMSILELREKLFDLYHLDCNISNGELSDMGYYCPGSSEKVYLSKQFYEKELEDYLNGNS